MRDLSERELLLLSNYLYIDKCTEYATINDLLDSCRDKQGNISPDNISSLGLGGCITNEEGFKLLCMIDESSDDFKGLNVSRSIDEGDIRAICFTFPDDEDNAAVVFRGTGGAYEAWADNVRGEYMPDTKLQKIADDFVRYDCGVYDSITVSGHSKGGNMAQYVTVTNADRVRRCISFDGQGFGRGFFGEYRQSIGVVSGRIKSISAHNDYVNILLGCIAGECVYVKNLRNDAVGRHSSFALLMSCEFDSEGNIVNTSGQDILTSILSGDLKKAVALIDMLPENGNISVSELLASSAAAFFSNEYDEEYEKSRIFKASEGVGEYIAGLMGLNDQEAYDVNVVTESVYVDVKGLAQALGLLTEIKNNISDINACLLELRSRIDYSAASKLAVDTVIHKQEKVLGRAEEKIMRYSEALNEIVLMYTGCENGITACISEAVV